MTDFDRFKLRLVKSSKNRVITPVYEKLKKIASKNGTLYGKPIKGTKPMPSKKILVPGAEKKKKKKLKKGALAKKPAGKKVAAKK